MYPYAALCVFVPLLIYWLLPPKRDTRSRLPEIHMPMLNHLIHAFPTHAPTTTPRRWQMLWLNLAWLSLVLALMYPNWLDKHTDVVQSGYDLMLAVDLSGSMEEADFRTPSGQAISRLAAVKSVLTPFIENRSGDRIGLILFADFAHLQAPLTLDNVAVNELLERARLGMAGEKTAIGDAIGLAVKKLRDRPAESRVLILLTDGDNTAGSLQPLQAAELAKDYDIRIYTIGVGGRGDFFRRGVDERTLRQIAELTGGQYYAASNLSALANVYNDIDQTLEKTEAESRVYLQRTPLYHYPLVVALLVLLLWQWQRGREDNA